MKKLLSILILLLSLAIFTTSCDDEDSDEKIVGLTDEGIIVKNKTTGETYTYSDGNSFGALGTFVSFFARRLNSDDFIDIQIDDPDEDGDISNRVMSGGNDAINVKADGNDYNLGNMPATYDFSGSGEETMGTINYTTDDDQEIEIEIK